jgi:adenosine deaminase CECR1
MPKGALLHAHLDGTVNVRLLLKLAYKQPEMHVRVDAKLTPSSLPTTLPEFRALGAALASDVKSHSLTDISYEPGSWVSLLQARENFPQEFGGPDGFDNWVTSALTINPSEAYDTHNTVAKVST